MKYPLEDIINFLKDQSHEDEISGETNVCDDIGISGDDFDEMTVTYAEKFSVDMSGYLWQDVRKYLATIAKKKI